MAINSAAAAAKAARIGSAATVATGSPSAVSSLVMLASLDDLQRRGPRQEGIEPRHATTNDFRSVRFDNRTRGAPKFIALVGGSAVEQHRRVIDRQNRQR